MESKLIRQKFLDFFKANQHKIVDSAPIVIKNDPSLMFTNAGMNQFKDYFLGNKNAPFPRIADTQKCLRVSGKHNDLEEVGTDGYHHTMFEMLGNWSFGDYFKKEAIEMAWKLLTVEFGIPKENLYVSVFGGDEKEGLDKDSEAVAHWKNWIDEDRILFFGKKDNFWEMGDAGPCGPCSEIHVDLRSQSEKDKIPGARLVNAGTPEVMEIWNLVFIQYNRKANGSLEELPAKHIDTGMGFERISMVLQNKSSSYDTDIFSPLIHFISESSGIPYTGSYDSKAKTDLAMRVLADHVRAVSFAIADGSIPSNTGPGYVIRRILRRAVRYYYSFLGIKSPFLYQLIPILTKNMGPVFSELVQQQELLIKVMREEEASFLKTLEDGLKRIDQLDPAIKKMDGQLAFELYDTYGFPFDLTQLIARENNWEVDESGFHAAMQAQKERSRSDAKKEYSDWHVLQEGESRFVGYDTLETEYARLLKWRKTESKSQQYFQLVFDQTPFYPEGGGEVGDTGILYFDEFPIEVIDTIKENDLILHITEALPKNPEAPVRMTVNGYRRKLIENNHSATHLLHAALRRVLGTHVQQRGSLVREDYLRFDFSHFQKMEDQEIAKVEQLVNEKIRQNIYKEEHRHLPIEKAKTAGAMMLFGEKYGDEVRMITFDPSYSVELCGGCHVEATGQIGYFKIVSESAIAAGIRRIEAVTGPVAENLIQEQFSQVYSIRQLLKNPKNLVEAIQTALDENKSLQKQIQDYKEEKAQLIKSALTSRAVLENGIHIIIEKLDLDDSKIVKNLVFQIGKALNPSIIITGFIENGKPQLMCYISEELVSIQKLNATLWIREIAKHIEGGGGGQAFFASAGGKKSEGLEQALHVAKEMVTKQLKLQNE
jgi:alanyl-tRNA synthetase